MYVNNGHVIFIRGVMDPVSLERRSLLSSAPVSNGQQKKRRIKCFRNYWKELKARSLNTPSILLLVYAASIPVCNLILSSIINDITNLPNDPCHPNSSGSSSGSNSWIPIIIEGLSYILIPFCGWLSDTKIGRGNAIYLSLWLGWIGTLLQSISCFVLSSFTNSLFFAKYQTGALIIAVIGFTLVSISLCLHFNLQHHFEHIPIPNPYKIVFKVLKYSIQNNHNRRQRSAFTYWGKEPSRIDLAKERYGGSFTQEEVENVKTLLRIAAVLIALIPFWIVTDPYMNTIIIFVTKFKDGYKGLQGHTSYIIWFIGYSVLFVLIPLFELVILPLFPKLDYFLINPLRGLGLANILIILSILSLFLIPHDIHLSCFSEPQPNDQTFQVSYKLLLIPLFFGGTSVVLTWLCMLEFLCSQAPFGMHGMIFGLFWFLHGIFFDTSIVIISLSLMHCTALYTIMLCLVGLVGLVVYVLTARWYVKRIRDTDLDLHTEIEQRWEQRLIREHSYVDSINDLTISNTSVN